jgi:hypothetical protein
MSKDEALKMAKEALETCSMFTATHDYSDYFYQSVSDAIDACKEALEQPAWQGLTDDEIDAEALKDDHAAYFALGALWANEKLKEKNT